jgi:hypothetical protein
MFFSSIRNSTNSYRPAIVCRQASAIVAIPHSPIAAIESTIAQSSLWPLGWRYSTFNMKVAEQLEYQSLSASEKPLLVEDICDDLSSRSALYCTSLKTFQPT